MSTPSTSTWPACGRLQAEDGPQQHRLAAAGAADDAEDLAATHLHVEAVVHQLAPEAVDDAAHVQAMSRWRVGHQKSIFM